MNSSLKYFFVAFFITFSFFGVHVAKIEAHTLQVDGSIGALMHTDPDDDVVAHQPAQIFLEFKDKNNKLDLSNCNCSFSINDQLISTSTLTISGMNVSFPYTFPKEDIYTLVVSSSSSAPFMLKYQINVDKEATLATSSPSLLNQLFSQHLFHVFVFVVAILIGIVLTITQS